MRIGNFGTAWFAFEEKIQLAGDVLRALKSCFTPGAKAHTPSLLAKLI
jgi:hypothetical protein